jgi:hypothetical protein
MIEHTPNLPAVFDWLRKAGLPEEGTLASGKATDSDHSLRPNGDHSHNYVPVSKSTPCSQA